ncbi:MAG TPA: hypothetical protein VK142_00405 [Bacillota bacterium]|nr:hypothetical protein [Bacillota bacterium]
MNIEGRSKDVLQAIMELSSQITQTEYRLSEKINMLDAKISTLSDNLA